MPATVKSYINIQRNINKEVNTPTALNGLILAGGKSTRMGLDKSLLNYNGKTQREHLYELLGPICSEVFISCNALQSEEITLPKIEDCFGESGPMGGVLSAFKYASNKAWLIIACDMPFLTATTLENLIAHRNPALYATAFQDPESGLPEPLITIWEPDAYPILQQAFAAGNTSLRQVLTKSSVTLLQAPNAKELLNINDHAGYLKIIHELKPNL